MTRSHCLCVGHFVLLHHTKEQEEEKEGMCDSPGCWCGCGQKALLWGVCERWMCDRGCVDESMCDVEHFLDHCTLDT